MRATRRVLALALASVSSLSVCQSADSPSTPSNRTGVEVTVEVTTQGVDPDPDGYGIQVGPQNAPVQANGSITLNGISAGTHEVLLTGVAHNCLVQGGLEQTLVVDGTDGAQVSFVVDCWADFGDALPTVACTGLSPAAAAGVPLDRIPVGALPGNFELPLFARVMTPDGSQHTHALVPVGVGGEAELIVPVHPSASPEGGDVLLRITDGSVACPPFELLVQPLTPSPGELSGVVALFQDLVRTQAALLGTTPEELVATPLSELPRAWIPLATIQSVLDHPGNDRSLAAIADGTSPISDDARLDLYEPLLARTGLRGGLEAAVATAQQGALASPPRVSVTALTCNPSAVGNDAGLLDRCMDAQASAAFEIAGGAWHEILDDVKDAFGVAEFIPGLGEVGGVGGAVLWVALNETDRAAALLPCCLTDFSADASPLVFEEDNPYDGSWFGATVTAVSLGWDLGKEVLEAAIAAGNVGGALDKALEADNLAGPEVPQIIGAFLTGPFAEELLGGGTIEAWQSPPEVFGPVGVGTEAWSESRIVGTAFEMTSHTDYRPREVGTATLALRTKGGEFGGQQLTRQFDLQVTRLGITISPTAAFVGANEVKTFDVRVENAFFPEMVEIDQDGLQGQAELTIGEGGSHYVTYVAPENPNVESHDNLTVRHTAETGVRANGLPQLSTATVRFGRIVIGPEGCVELSGTRTFTAVVEGFDDQTVRWTSDVGTIDEDTGEYQAPSTPPPGGTATIRAESAADPDLFAELEIPLGCTCASTLTLAGQAISAQPGDQVYFTDWGGPTDPYGNNKEFFAIVFQQADGTYTVAFPLDEDPSTWPVVGGYNPVRAQGSIGLSDSEILYSSDDDFPAILDLDEYVPEHKAVGRVTATVNIISSAPPYSTPATLDWTFAVTVPAGQQRGPVLAPWGYRFTCTVGGG